MKIIEIQNIVLKEQKRGVSYKWIFDNLIKKPYFISYSTFNVYMRRNAKRELADLDKGKGEEDKRQLRLF